MLDFYNTFSSTLSLLAKFDGTIVYIVLALSLFGVILIFIHRWKQFSKIDDAKNAYRLNSIRKRNRSKNNINSNNNLSIDLKLQAYERLTIFLSRIDPWRLLSLVKISEKKIKTIEDYLLQIVISEFEYNLSQQVYVSDGLWELVETSKNKTIQLILSVKVGLDQDASGQEFYNHLESILKNQDITPSKITLDYLKKEVRSI